MIADITAIIDNAEEATDFIDAASSLADAQNAHLTIVVFNDIIATINTLAPDDDPSSGFDKIGRVETGLIEAVRERLSKTQRSFEVRAITDTPGFLSGAARVEGRYADMLLMGSASAYRTLKLRRRCVEAALMGGSGPVLMLPDRARPARFRHAVLGWDASAEARRAARELCTTLDQGAQIDIAVVDPETNSSHGGEPGSDIARHLARHGFDVETHRLSSVGSDVSRVIEEFALGRGADLLAIGGFAHSRVRDILLGGVTRDYLASTKLPVMLAR